MIKLPSKIQNHYEKIEQITPKEFGIRKKLDIFITSNNNDKTIILHITQKSRFIKKDAQKIEEIYSIIQKEIPSKHKIILIESPLCSKAKEQLEELLWKVLV